MTLPDVPEDVYHDWQVQQFSQDTDNQIGSLGFETAANNQIATLAPPPDVSESLSRIGSWATPTPLSQPPSEEQPPPPPQPSPQLDSPPAAAAAAPAPDAPVTAPLVAPQQTPAPAPQSQPSAVQGWIGGALGAVQQAGGDVSTFAQQFKTDSDNLIGSALGAAQAAGADMNQFASRLPALPHPSATAGAGGDLSQATPDQVEAYIRQAAAQRGIDPETAVKVAQGEGGLVPNRTGSFATGKSFWPFQLHYGGAGTPYADFGTTAGMGNDFTAQTGYQPGDPNAWQAATDYALDKAKAGGWGPWYGASAQGITGFQGINRNFVQQAGDVLGGAASALGGAAQGVVQKTANLVSQFGDNQLSTDEAYAACGPAAAVRFAQAYGRNPTLSEAVQLAKTVGWTPQNGMAGIGSEQQLLQKMNIPTQLVGPDLKAIAQEASTGNPVTISTPGHYFFADGYDPNSGAFHVGKSGTDLKNGSEWMTAAQMTRLMGPIQGALFADNPTVPAPSTSDQTSDPLSYLDRTRAAIGGTFNDTLQQQLQSLGSTGQDILSALGQAKDQGVAAIQGAQLPDITDLLQAPDPNTPLGRVVAGEPIGSMSPADQAQALMQWQQQYSQASEQATQRINPARDVPVAGGLINQATNPEFWLAGAGAGAAGGLAEDLAVPGTSAARAALEEAARVAAEGGAPIPDALAQAARGTLTGTLARGVAEGAVFNAAASAQQPGATPADIALGAATGGVAGAGLAGAGRVGSDVLGSLRQGLPDVAAALLGRDTTSAFSNQQLADLRALDARLAPPPTAADPYNVDSLMRAYEAVTPDRIDSIRNRVQDFLAPLITPKDGDPQASRDLIQQIWDAGVNQLQDSRVTATGLSDRAAAALADTGQFTNKLNSVGTALDSAMATRSQVGPSRVDINGAIDFVNREAAADNMALGSTQALSDLGVRDPEALNRVYAHTTAGPPMLGPQKPVMWVTWEDDAPRVVTAHHHYGIGSPDADIHVYSTPPGLKSLMWDPAAVQGDRVDTPTGPVVQNWQQHGIDVGGGRKIANTDALVGPSGENDMKMATLLASMSGSGPDNLQTLIRSGKLTDPEQIASILLRESAVQSSPGALAAKKVMDMPPSASFPQDVLQRLALGAVDNGKRTESLMVDPQLRHIKAIYLAGTPDDINATKAIPNVGGRSRLQVAQGVRQQIRDKTGKDVPIIFKDITPQVTGKEPSIPSKLISDARVLEGPKNVTLAPGRQRIVSNYTAAGFPNIGLLPQARAVAEAAGISPTEAASRTVYQRLKDSPMLTAQDAAQVLGSKQLPGYLDGVVQYLTEQRQKVAQGALTSRDVAKAWLLTLSSMRSQAREEGKVGAGLADVMNLPGEAASTIAGKRVVRPEDATAAWMLTPEGRAALDSFAAGNPTPAALKSLEDFRKAAGFGQPMMERSYLTSQKAGGERLPVNWAQNIPEVTARLNAAAQRGDWQAFDKATQELRGIGPNKTAFVKQLLGLGNGVTVDSNEVNWWLFGKGDAGELSPEQAAFTGAIGRGTPASGIPQYLQQALTDRFGQLRDMGYGQDIPADAYNHVMHHWLWDTIKNATTPHTAMYDAMRNALVASESPTSIGAGLRGVLSRAGTGAAYGAIGSGYQESQRQGATPQSIAGAALGGAASGAGQSLIGRLPIGVAARALAEEEGPPLTREASDLLRIVRTSGIPNVLTGNLQRIAQDNGIPVRPGTTPAQIINSLQAKLRISDLIDQLPQEARDAYGLTSDTLAQAGQAAHEDMLRLRQLGGNMAADNTVSFDAAGNPVSSAAQDLQRAYAAREAVPGSTAELPSPPLPQGAREINLSPGEQLARLRLDQFPEDLRQTLADAAQNVNWANDQRRGVIPDAVAENLAREYANNTTLDQLIANHTPGQAYNTEQLRALRNAVGGQGAKVADLAAAIQKGDDSTATLGQWLNEGDKLQRLMQMVEGGRAEAGRGMRAFQQDPSLINLSPGEAAAKIISSVGRDNLMQHLANYQQLIDQGANPMQLAKFWNGITQKPPTAFDWYKALRYNSMISGLPTVERIGLSGALENLYAGLREGGTALATGNPREAASVAKGAVLGFGKGAQNAAQTLVHGINEEQALAGGFPRGIASRVTGPARGLATALEAPGRIHSALQDITQGTAYGMRMYQRAAQLADDAGLSGKAASDYIHQTVNDAPLTPAGRALMRDAQQFAQRASMRGEMGTFGTQLANLGAKGGPIGHIILPFARVAYNQLARGIDQSPAGLIGTAIDLARTGGRYAGANTEGQVANLGLRGVRPFRERLTDNVIGSLLTYAAYQEALQGNVTGAGPQDTNRLDELKAGGWQPYSLRVGGTYVPYRALGRFGIPLALAASLAESQTYPKTGQPQPEDLWSGLGDATRRVGEFAANETYLSDVGNIMRGIQQPDRYAKSFVSDYVASHIPYGALLSNIVQATSGTPRSPETGSTVSIPEAALQTVESRIPGLSSNLPARQDVLGRPVPQLPGAGWAPEGVSPARSDAVLTELMNHGVTVPPTDKIATSRSGTAEVQMTPGEQRLVQARAGYLINQMVQQYTSDPSYGTMSQAEQTALLSRLASAAHAQAEQELIGSVDQSRLQPARKIPITVPITQREPLAVP